MIEYDCCDRCGLGVRAYFFVEMSSGPLAYCGSCGNRFRDAILAQGGRILLDGTYMREG